MAYVNVDSWVVILADSRDADVSWRHHRERKSLGGVDCVAPIGSPIHAPTDGVINFQFNNGSGGHTATLTADDGWKDQFMHLSAFVGIGGRRVKMGDLIGYTGNTVAPGYPFVSPHLHWHRIDPRGWYADAWGSTNRRNPWHYFTSSTAGGGFTPIEETKPEKRETEMIYDVLQPIGASSAPDGRARGWLLIGPGYVREISATHWEVLKNKLEFNVISASAVEYDIIKANMLQGNTALDSDILTRGDVAAVVNPRFDAIDVAIKSIDTELDGISEQIDGIPQPEPEPEPNPEPEPEPLPDVQGPLNGIDLAWPQMASENDGDPFPYAQAAAEGVSFFGVKASGFNIGTLYVADGYHEHVDGIQSNVPKAPIFHYYVPGAGGVITQADYFVDNLYKFRLGFDAVALDNEPLNNNGVFWTQNDVVAWHQRVHERLLTHSYAQHWNYFPAFLTRQNVPWDKVEALGVQRWWAAYGTTIPTGKTPDHEPLLQTSDMPEPALTGWDVHQYTNQFAVAGRSVDGNYSKKSLSELFGWK